jgi:6,7-dimethyl-8-ribityllumazine synthase
VAGTGSPDLRDLVASGARDLRVAVVAARWHEQAMAGLLGGALTALADLGVEEPTVVRVPGSFELPVAAKHLAERSYDAVVALGVVVRGGTPHFEYVCDAATRGLTDVAVRTGVPVGFGVLTCDTNEQALDRAGLPGSAENRGRDAALAAIATCLAIREAAAPWDAPRGRR